MIAGLELASETTAPPAGAAPDKPIVALTLFPPTTVDGVTVIDETLTVVPTVAGLKNIPLTTELELRLFVVM
jgi:hypothetical protein